MLPTTNQIKKMIQRLKANLASPTFTGTPKAPTAAANTNNTQIATTEFVHSAKNYFATVDSASGGDTFNLTIAGFVLQAGTKILVKFTDTLLTGALKFNINNTGAKDVYISDVLMSGYYLRSGSTHEFVYDGSTWRYIGYLSIEEFEPEFLYGGHSVGNPVLTPTYAKFKHRAIYFDGYSALTFFNLINDSGKSLSVECWTYIDSSSAEKGVIFNLFLGAGNGEYRYLRLQVNKTAGFAYFSFSYHGETYYLAEVPFDQLCHVAFTYNQDTLEITGFLNGKKQQTFTLTNPIEYSEIYSLTLGGLLAGGGDRFVGTTMAKYYAYAKCYLCQIRVSNAVLWYDDFDLPTSTYNTNLKYVRLYAAR